MDNLTHSLVGALIGQAGLKQKTGLAMPALIIGANLPDVDAACFFWLDGVEHLGFRRGITHGPIALLLLPLILAGLLWGFDRWQTRHGTRPEGRLPISFNWLFLLSFLACLTHPALDWLNVYGIRLLEPFSSRWFYGDTLFIIDVWLWALMGFATWFSLRREGEGGNWMKPARVAIAVSLAYIGLNGLISAHAADAVESAHFNAEHPVSTIASPLPLAFWEREVIRTGLDSTATAAIYHLHLWRAGEGLISQETVPQAPCQWRDWDRSNPGVDAFLFWSRTPMAARGEDGSVVLHDARFYDPLARDNFSVRLPARACKEPSAP
jgi:inner membrane protein